MTDVVLDADAEAERRNIFTNPDEQKKLLENERIKDTNRIRLQYVSSAKGLAKLWVGFSIIISICQFIKPFGRHLEQAEFIAIVATALGSVIGLWAIVGSGLFKARTE